MPTYEYLCEKCEHEFEREQRISDPPVKTCPECRSRKVTRLISRTSFVLKGGGWYSDLYSSPNARSEDRKDKDAKGGDGKDKPAGGADSSSTAASSGADAKSTDKPEKSGKSKASKAAGSKSAA